MQSKLNLFADETMVSWLAFEPFRHRLLFLFATPFFPLEAILVRTVKKLELESFSSLFLSTLPSLLPSIERAQLWRLLGCMGSVGIIYEFICLGFQNRLGTAVTCLNICILDFVLPFFLFLLRLALTNIISLAIDWLGCRSPIDCADAYITSFRDVRCVSLILSQGRHQSFPGDLIQGHQLHWGKKRTHKDPSVRYAKFGRHFFFFRLGFE